MLKYSKRKLKKMHEKERIKMERNKDFKASPRHIEYIDMEGVFKKRVAITYIGHLITVLFDVVSIAITFFTKDRSLYLALLALTGLLILFYPHMHRLVCLMLELRLFKRGTLIMYACVNQLRKISKERISYMITYDSDLKRFHVSCMIDGSPFFTFPVMKITPQSVDLWYYDIQERELIVPLKEVKA